MKKVLAIALMVISTMSHSQASQDPIGQLSASGGRYVLGQISSFRRDQFMLDTQTGRVWTLSCLEVDKTDPNNCKQRGLVQIPIIDGAEKFGWQPANIK